MFFSWYYSIKQAHQPRWYLEPVFEALMYHYAGYYSKSHVFKHAFWNGIIQWNMEILRTL